MNNYKTIFKQFLPLQKLKTTWKTKKQKPKN